MNELTKEERWEVAQRHRSSMQLQNAICFANVEGKTPSIDFYQDGDYFTNHELIHMGAYSNVFGPVYDETDLVEQWEFARGHEGQHCRSTANIPYGIGIKRGCEVIIEYIASKVESKPVRFKKDSDYQFYADSLESKGIYLNFRIMQEIVSGLQNSLEDGRIERIRSNIFPGFESLRLKYRGMFWNAGTSDYPKYETIKDNASAKLRIILNNVLSLATCQLYEKAYKRRKPK